MLKIWGLTHTYKIGFVQLETVIHLLFDKINVIKRIYYFQTTIVFSSPFSPPSDKPIFGSSLSVLGMTIPFVIDENISERLASPCPLAFEGLTNLMDFYLYENHRKKTKWHHRILSVFNIILYTIKVIPCLTLYFALRLWHVENKFTPWIMSLTCGFYLIFTLMLWKTSMRSRHTSKLVIEDSTALEHYCHAFKIYNNPTFHSALLRCLIFMHQEVFSFPLFSYAFGLWLDWELHFIFF